MPQPTPTLVTCALLYANGPMHLGHCLEFIQADIFVRSMQLSGQDCIFLCGSDAHGTPIMLAAEKLGVSPTEMVEKIGAEHKSALDELAIKIDNFGSTNSPINQDIVYAIYDTLKQNSDIATKIVEQAFDEEKQMFLADRYVQGTCPRCKTPNQYGDSCEACGATYSTRDLIDPISTLSNTAPIYKPTEQIFFKLKNYAEHIQQWIKTDSVQPSVANKLQEWFKSGIEDWCISRDAPYFGFKIPGTDDKYFYVWLDAPIGYMQSLAEFNKNTGRSFDYWDTTNNANIMHFIGKDVAYFHTLFWPALLEASGKRLPSKVHVHGFLTINGAKMSKSRGTFITAQQYLQHLPADFLRYYFAAKLNPQIEDIDFNLEDFASRVNSDLVGKYINIASRSAKFINKSFDAMLSSELEDKAAYEEFASANQNILTLLLELKTAQAVREIMRLADVANQYAEKMQPWVLAKADPQDKKIQLVCTQLINYFRMLSIWLKPIIPNIVANAEKFLNCELYFASSHALLDHKIEKFKPLAQRITPEQLEQLINA